jgi:hypothetical protein
MSRQGICKAQYLAGREYQKHAGIADGQPGALERCHRELGADGTALVHDMLISVMSHQAGCGIAGHGGPGLGEVLHAAPVGISAGSDLRLLGRGKENPRFWHQNTNHWRAVTRPGWDAPAVITLPGILIT